MLTDSSLSYQIGLRIIKLREERRMTTTDLAQRVGVSQAQISRLENGKQGFRTNTLEKIAEALGVSIARFFEPEESGHFWGEIARQAFRDPKFARAVESAADAFVSSGRAEIKV